MDPHVANTLLRDQQLNGDRPSSGRVNEIRILPMDSHLRKTVSQRDLTKAAIYRKYFRQKIVYWSCISSIPLALILCIIQATIMVIFLDSENFQRPVQSFERSGIGLIAAGLTTIALLSSLFTSKKISYGRLLLTFVTHKASLATHLGLIGFALTSPFPMFNWIIHSLTLCNCYDGEGSILRNGTEQTHPSCDMKQYQYECSEVDRQLTGISWEMALIWTMIGTAIIQSIILAIVFFMTINTFICIRNTFDKLALSIPSMVDVELTRNFYTENFSLRKIRTISWIQAGFLVFMFILTLCIQPRYIFTWQAVQLAATGSFMLLNWVSSNRNLNYTKLTIVALFHFLITILCGTTVILIGLEGIHVPWEEQRIVYPFLSIEIFTCSSVLFMSLLPMFKVDLMGRSSDV